MNRIARAARVGALILFAARGGRGEAGEPSSPRPPSVRLSHPEATAVLERALRGALRKVARPDCQRLLREFKDLSGRPLQEALDATGMGAEEHLASMLFYDGPAESACRSRQAYATTRPGQRVVFVCARQFTKVAFESPGLAEAVVIHEWLHSLGLGENPPRSAEITSRVRTRCRRR